MNTRKKIGHLLLCPIPFILMLLVQTVCTSVFMVILAILHGPDTFQTYFFDHYTEFLAIIQVLTLLLFGFWYYMAYFRHRPIPRPKEFFSGREAGLLLLLGFGLYCVISLFMVAASFLAPELMADYEALIEETGLADLTLLSSIATLILAPLLEELVFRGLTLRFARKAFGKFWIANVIQAALFGIAHMNLVQGLYAFVLGLMLGYVCQRLHTLYAGILLHLAFNFCGTWFAMLLGILPFPESVTALLLFVIGAPLTWYCIRNLSPNQPSDPASIQDSV